MAQQLKPRKPLFKEKKKKEVSLLDLKINVWVLVLTQRKGERQILEFSTSFHSASQFLLNNGRNQKWFQGPGDQNDRSSGTWQSESATTKNWVLTSCCRKSRQAGQKEHGCLRIVNTWWSLHEFLSGAPNAGLGGHSTFSLPGSWSPRDAWESVQQQGEAKEWVFSSLAHTLNTVEPVLSFLPFTSHYLIGPLHTEPSLLLKCFPCLPFLFRFHGYPSTSSPCQLMPDLIQHLPRRCPCLQGLPTPIHPAQLPGKASLGDICITSSPISRAHGVSGCLLPPTSPVPLLIVRHAALHSSQAWWLLKTCIWFSFITFT